LLPEVETLIAQVDILTEQLHDSQERFDAMVTEQAETVKQLDRRNRQLDRRNQLLAGLVSLLVAGSIGIGVAVGVALDASHDAQRAIARAERVEEIRSYESCLSSNRFRSFEYERNQAKVDAAQKEVDALSVEGRDLSEIPGYDALGPIQVFVDGLVTSSRIQRQIERDAAELRLEHFTEEAAIYRRDFPLRTCVAPEGYTSPTDTVS
jgi:hypothetical protein